MGDYEFWLKRNKDKKNVLGNLAWVKQYLGICKLLHSIEDLQYLNRELQSRIKDLEKPLRKKKILKLLAEDGNPRTMRWLAYRMREVWLEDLWELQKEGKLAVEVHGHHRMYGLEDPLRLVLAEGGLEE